MAADFPPNLDDGELWLPSEIIADVGVCRRQHRQSSAALRHGYASDLGYIEDLAQQLAALRLLDRNHHFSALKQNPNVSLHPEGFMPARPVVRFGPAEREVLAGLAYDGFRPPAAGRVLTGVGSGVYFPAACLPHQFNSRNPIQPQVDPFQMERAVVLQRQQSHGVNRFIPPVRVHGSGRKCGGTGVFLPRVAFNEDVRKKPSMKGGEQEKQQSTRNTVKQGMMMMPLQPITELGLPQDWTY